MMCYFSGLPSDLACEAPDLSPYERVRVERDKFRNGTVFGNAPEVLIVCSECADGWDEIVQGYGEEPDIEDEIVPVPYRVAYAVAQAKLDQAEMIGDPFPARRANFKR